MTELSDYRRMVEGPMVKRYEERIANLITEIERLRALASPQPSEDEVERVADAMIGYFRDHSIYTALLRPQLLDALRAAMSPRPQPGMISADRACEIIRSFITRPHGIYDTATITRPDIEEAINTIRMEASALPEPPKE